MFVNGTNPIRLAQAQGLHYNAITTGLPTISQDSNQRQTTYDKRPLKNTSKLPRLHAKCSSWASEKMNLLCRGYRRRQKSIVDSPVYFKQVLLWMPLTR